MHSIKKLKNGITLITVPVKGTKAMTVLAMFPVGSRYETKIISGASHFVEHMMFKGTKTRSTALEISRILDAVGAEYNAFTDKDYTGYYIKIDSAKHETAFDLLSDMVFESLIDAEEVEKEKGTIVEEIRMYDDNPLMAVDFLAEKLVFGDNPLGWDIAGTAESVRGMSREDLWNYYQRHYCPGNMVLVVAGDVQSKKFKKLFNYFESKRSERGAAGLSRLPRCGGGRGGGLPFYKKNFEKFSWPSVKSDFVGRLAVAERKVDQAQVIINFPGVSNNDDSRFALSILLNILGGGMSSRLFVEVREKRGLAYMIRASGDSFRETGLCGIQAGLDPARLKEALQVIEGEVGKIAGEPVTDRELKDAKTNLAGRMALSLEDSSVQAGWYAKQFLFSNRILTPDDVIKKIKKVTVKQVQEVAKKYIDWKEARLAIIGPFGKEKVLEILK